MLSTWRLHRAILALLISGLPILASCAAPAAAGDPPDSGAGQAVVQHSESVRVSGRAIPEPVTSGPIVRQDRAEDVPAPASALVPPTIAQNGDVSLHYVDTDVREVAKLILGDILKLNYTIDPGFMGTVTIETARPLRREELLSTLQSLLNQTGGIMTYDNGFFRIGPAGDDSMISPLVDGASAAAGSEIVRLRYASARQLSAMLGDYIGDGAKLLADPTRNMLIVTGSASARRNVIDLIRVFDVDFLAGRSYALFPVKFGEPARFAADLQAALQLDNDGALAGAIKIVPVEQANAIMVIAQQPAYLDRVTQLIGQLDKVNESARRGVHVDYLKNVQATDIQPVLQRAINPRAGAAAEMEIAPGNIPPTAQPMQLGAPPAAPLAQANAVAPALPGAAGAFGAVRPGMPPGAPANMPAADPGQDNTSGDPRGPQIIADRSSNALVIVATEAEYATIEAAIRKLDIVPMQVLIEATVAEVTLNDELQFGAQYFLSNRTGQVTLSNAASSPTAIDPTTAISNSALFPGTLAPNFPGLAIARTIGSVQFAIQALKTITDVQVISAPKLLVLDKQEATIQVGDLVPTITQSAESVVTAGAPVVNNVQYQPTGVILNVLPRLNASGLVTLDIEQEVSDVVPTTSSTINSPTFEQRRIKTKVVVQDGETITLGGLISNKKSKANSGIPILQQIPLLGPLFSTRDNVSDRTEILVLLTTHVVYDENDARALTEELRRKLAPSRLVP
ncbi:MAG: type II secretion system secretin GspD [Alphaproteobacteria bacterium]|nr:type II secretion system secretin GspD [Alphaproteobacteria bacterium]